MAQLKFESASGLKRLDLYPVNGNRRLPGSPSTTVPLTHALGAISGKHHAITRAKHTFLVRILIEGGWREGEGERGREGGREGEGASLCSLATHDIHT